MNTQIKPAQLEPGYDISAFGEDDEVSQSAIHNALILYLSLVLARLFVNQQQVGIYTSIQLFGDPLFPTIAKSPDLLVIDGWPFDPTHDQASYYITPQQKPPRVAIEISSGATWQNDLEQKPEIYARMGITEYFASDPHPERVWTGRWRQEGRLVGWQQNGQGGQYERIKAAPDGRLWSNQLNSWLDGRTAVTLRLYSKSEQLRLTGEEAERQWAEIQQQRAEAEHQRAETQQQRAEAERQRAERLAALLKQLNPNFTDEDLQ